MKKRQINLVIGDKSIQYRKLLSPDTHRSKKSWGVFKYDNILSTSLMKYNYITGITDIDKFKSILKWAEDISGNVSIMILREDHIDILHHLNKEGIFEREVLNSYIDTKKELTDHLEATYAKISSTTEFLKLKIK